jgi:hypothetical protein
MFKKPANAAMTDSQWRLFWRLWKSACDAQGWTKAKGFSPSQVDQQRYAVLNRLGFNSLLQVNARAGFDRLKAELERLAGQVSGAAEQAAAASGRDMGQERRLRYVLARELLPGVAAYFGDPKAYVATIVEDKFAADLGFVPTIAELTDEPTFVPRMTRSGESRVLEQPSRLEQLVMTLRERIRGEAQDVGHDALAIRQATDARYNARRDFFHQLAGCGSNHESGRNTQSVSRPIPGAGTAAGTGLEEGVSMGSRSGMDSTVPAEMETEVAAGSARQDFDPYAGSGWYKGD